MDTQREEFHGRIARLGGQGDAIAPRRPRPVGRANWVAPAVMLLAALIATKAVVHARVGPDSYNHRLTLLAAGDRADRIGAWVLAADPLTRELSALLRGIAR